MLARSCVREAEAPLNRDSYTSNPNSRVYLNFTGQGGLKEKRQSFDQECKSFLNRRRIANTNSRVTAQSRSLVRSFAAFRGVQRRGRGEGGGGGGGNRGDGGSPRIRAFALRLASRRTVRNSDVGFMIARGPRLSLSQTIVKVIAIDGLGEKPFRG